VHVGLRAAGGQIQQTQSETEKSHPNSSGRLQTQHEDEGEKGSDVKRVNWRSMWELMLAQFLLDAAFILYRVDFAVTVSDRYDTSNAANGYLTSLASAVRTATGFAVGYIAFIYAENTQRLLLHSAALQSLSFLVIAYAPRLTPLTAGHAAHAFSYAVSQVTFVQAALLHGSRKHTGALIGAGATILSVARMLAPTVNGVSREFFSSYDPFVLSAFLAIAGTAVLLFVPGKSRVKTHSE